jgi:hypothetical protein
MCAMCMYIELVIPKRKRSNVNFPVYVPCVCWHIWGLFPPVEELLHTTPTRLEDTLALCSHVM